MRQLLIRVPDDLHARLTARAYQEGRSVNQLANEVLDAAANVEVGDRRTRLRARAAELGWLVELPVAGPQISDEERAEIIEANRGLGPFIDDFIKDQREF